MPGVIRSSHRLYASHLTHSSIADATSTTHPSSKTSEILRITSPSQRDSDRHVIIGDRRTFNHRRRPVAVSGTVVQSPGRRQRKPTSRPFPPSHLGNDQFGRERRKHIWTDTFTDRESPLHRNLVPRGAWPC